MTASKFVRARDVNRIPQAEQTPSYLGLAGAITGTFGVVTLAIFAVLELRGVQDPAMLFALITVVGGFSIYFLSQITALLTKQLAVTTYLLANIESLSRFGMTLEQRFPVDTPNED